MGIHKTPETCADERPQAQTGLTVRLFGAFAMERAGTPLPRTRTCKERWLLALLALNHGKPLERAWLAATLWLDSSQDQALDNLRRSLYNLRQVLGADSFRLLSPTPRTVSFDPSGAMCDVIEFDRAVARAAGAPSHDVAALVRAIELYRGPLMEACDAEWATPERETRKQAYLTVLESLAAHAGATGNVAEAIRCLRLAVAVDPFRETAQRALIEALAAAGDMAATTLAYRQLRLRLHDELRAEPAPETTALYQRLRTTARMRSTQTAIDGGPRSSLLRVPRPISGLVGRIREVAEVASLLASARLVTLAGSGGIGKTRLAIAVAESVATTFPDGVWFVDLASYSDGAFVLPAVTAILGVRVEPGRPQAETLARFLAAKSLLLILDNCEHLLPHCARLADALLQACPGLRILATSRQTLNYPGEGAWRVPSLELPAADTLQNGSLQNGSLQQMMQADAVRLFVERAMDASPAFLLTDRNVKAVVEVCRRLDGIPLAIELAAARVKVLSVEQIAARLNDRFRLLTGGSPAALPRQQTLQACTDWSYDLLSALGKVLLRRLSVFAGGWTLEAAETVCTGNGVGQDALLDLLAELADKSLVIVEEVEGAARYRLLETIRQYGQERLRESGEAAGVGRRHLEYYLRLAESVPEQRTGPDQMSWFARLERDHDNLRTAYRFAIGDETFTGRSPAASPPDGRATTELALRLCAALRRFWELKGHVAEGREWCALALGQQEAPGETQARAEALNCAGALAAFLGEYADARQCLQESLGVYRKLGHRRGIASSLADLGLVTRELGDYAGALAYDEESLALYRELGDRPGISALLSNLGLVAENQGDYRLARSYYEESLSIRRKMGHKAGIGATVHGLGLLAFRQGHNTTARHLYEEALELYRQLGDRAGIAWLFNNLGLLAYREGQYTEARAYHTESLSVFREIGTRLGIAYALEAFAGLAATEAPLSLEAPAPEIRRAACLWGAAERLREEIGIPLPSSERAEREQQVARVRSALGEDAFMTAYTAGSEMSMEAAIEYSLRT